MGKMGHFRIISDNPIDPQHVFAIGTEVEHPHPIRFLRSFNGGLNWEKIYMVLDWNDTQINGMAICSEDTLFNGMAICPYDDNVIFVAMHSQKGGIREDSIIKSTDRGSTWSVIKSYRDTEINDIVVDPNSSQNVYIATNKGIYRSVDSGHSWKNVFDESAYCLEIPLNDPKQIFAGCENSVYGSFDGGETWTKLNAEKHLSRVENLEFHEPSHTLYASIENRGLVTYNTMTNKNFLAVYADVGGTTKPEPGIYFYPPNTKIDIMAFPDNYYEFEGWGGSKSGKANPITVTVDSDMTVKANFYVLLFPPSDFWGEKVVNRSLSMIEHINVLRWQRNPENFQIDKYELYRIEGGVAVLVAKLDSETFEYWDRRVDKDQEYNYALVAVHITGEKSDPALTTIK
ncbi:MAG: hypothetical protein JSV17_13940 [Candidatus Aminicenantes bacterium]|nr:MAG: hypothetical protein JSV17_13940 [Candidatus Aminicenantes bacterium]